MDSRVFRGVKFTCSKITGKLREMMMYRPAEKQGYMASPLFFAS